MKSYGHAGVPHRETTKIIIADDHEVVRLGLRTWLEKQPGYQIVAEAVNGEQAVAMAKELLPDVIIMDITMPGLSGIEATKQITEADASINVIALSIHSDKRFVARMIGVGARGYLQKECAFREIVRAIETVFTDQIYISPSIAGDDVRVYLRQLKSSTYQDPLQLTDTERDILKYIALGKSTKEIADLCFLSVKAIERYRHLLMEKLDMHSIAELTKYAVSEGLISLE